MLRSSLLPRCSVLACVVPLVAALQSVAWASPAAPRSPAVEVRAAEASPSAAASALAAVDLAPPRFGSEPSVRWAMAARAVAPAEAPSLLPDLRRDAEAGAAGGSAKDKAADEALRWTIVYGSLSVGCFSFATVFIPIGAYYFFGAVAARGRGEDPGFQPTMPLFFIGLGLLVPGFIFLSMGLDQLRLYRELIATSAPAVPGPAFAGLAPPAREFTASGDLVLFAF